MENEIQPNTSQVQPVNQIPAPISTSTTWVKIIILILLGIIIIAGAVFLGIQLGKKQVSNQHLITNQPTIAPTQKVVNPTILPITITNTFGALKRLSLNVNSTPTPTPDPTANWKTITSKFWIFKVPQNWNYHKCLEVDEWLSAGPEIPKDITVSKIECEGGGYPTLAIVRNFGKFSIPVTIPQDKSDPNKYFLTVTNKKNVQISGENAITQSEYSYPFGPNNGVESIAIYIQKLDYTDSIVISDRTSEDPNTPIFSETKKFFDQILSTFKFSN